MGIAVRPLGRVSRVLAIAFVVVCSGLAPLPGPGVALAQQVQSTDCLDLACETMLPDALQREIHKVETRYRELMRSVNTAQSERLARQAAGAAEAELRELDQKLGALVSQAEKLKVQLDYMEELYKDKKIEYRGK